MKLHLKALHSLELKRTISMKIQYEVTNMKKVLMTLLILCLLLSSIGFAETTPITPTATETVAVPVVYTLESATAALLKDNLDVKLAKLSIEAAELGLDEAKKTGKRYRNIKEEGGYSNFYAELFGSAAGKYLLNGVPEKAAELQLMIANKTQAMTEEGLRMGLKESFYSILNAENALKIKEQSAERLKELYTTSTKKYELGLISKNALATTKVDYEAGLSAVDTAKRELAIKKMSFNQTMNLPLETPFSLQGTLVYTPLAPVNLKEKVAYGLENRMDVIAKSQAKTIAEITYDVDESLYTPNTYLYKNSLIARDKAVLEHTKILLSAELAIIKAHNDMISAEKAYLDLLKSLELVRDGYNVAKTMYSVGMNTQSDVTSALIQLNNMESNVSQALLGVKLAEMAFEASYKMGLAQ